MHSISKTTGLCIVEVKGKTWRAVFVGTRYLITAGEPWNLPCVLVSRTNVCETVAPLKIVKVVNETIFFAIHGHTYSRHMHYEMYSRVKSFQCLRFLSSDKLKCFCWPRVIINSHIIGSPATSFTFDWLSDETEKNLNYIIIVYRIKKTKKQYMVRSAQQSQPKSNMSFYILNIKETHFVICTHNTCCYHSDVAKYEMLIQNPCLILFINVYIPPV